MKKKTFFIIIIILIIIAGLILCDYFRFENNKKPLFCVNTQYDYKDGNVNVCIGFGYKIVNYNRVSIKKREFIPIWRRIKNPNLNSNYKIVDETEICATALEKIYDDGIYVYSLPCIQSDTIFLVYKDGTKISVYDALHNKIVDINDLIGKGLFVYKDYKKD